MKLQKTILRAFILVLALGLCFHMEAQEDTTRLKFSEEIAAEPDNKNVKWVKLRSHEYNMDNVSSLFKIGTSALYAIALDDIFLDFSYEKKIPRSQWSVELKLRADIGRNYYYRYYGSLFTNSSNLHSSTESRNYLSLDLVARHYLLKNSKMAQGKSGDNLWGFYATARLISPVTWSKELETVYDTRLGFNSPYQIKERNGLSTRSGYLGVGLGYQQRFLKRAYFDVNGGYAQPLRQRVNYSFDIFLDFTVGYSIFKVK